MKKVRDKPAPPSRKIARTPPTPAAGEASQGINEVSSITAKQMARAERAIDNLREEVKGLRQSPPPVTVKTDAPNVVVELPPRPRIASVKIKYDALGMPAEMVPVYKEV